MSNSLEQRIFVVTLVLAVAAGVWTLPQQVPAAWTVGTPIVTYWKQDTTTGKITSTSATLTDAVAQQAVNGGYNLVWAGHSQMAIAQ